MPSVARHRASWQDKHSNKTHTRATDRRGPGTVRVGRRTIARTYTERNLLQQHDRRASCALTVSSGWGQGTRHAIDQLCLSNTLTHALGCAKEQGPVAIATSHCRRLGHILQRARARARGPGLFGTVSPPRHSIAWRQSKRAHTARSRLRAHKDISAWAPHRTARVFDVS